MKEQIENIIKKWLENESKSAYVDYIDFADVTMDGSFDLEELSSLIADEVLRVIVGTPKLGDKINAFGKEYEIVGLSRMIYDKDCEGEPEWKITKEIQEIAIAKIYPDISYQKPSWHKLEELLSTVSPIEENK